MAVINKLRIDGYPYDVEDAILKEKVDNLSMPYSSSGSYSSGTLGKAVQDLEANDDVATDSDILSALYS